MTSAPAVVELDGVHKSYGTGGTTVAVLRGVELRVAAGEIVAVAGRSGSGKTTLLTLVAGFERADAGVVEVDGAPAAAVPPWSTLAVVPQSLGLVDELTVAENVALAGRLAGPGTGADLPGDELLDQLGVGHLRRRFPDEISLGEQQRVAVARAAATRPVVLLADEPISHQNEGWARTVMLVLERLADAGTACLIATHNAVAFESAHRVVELDEGRLRARSEGAAAR
jgi:putative ABC transport system ATP-binding protein